MNNEPMRLLPWKSDTGKPCYLVPDSGNSDLTMLADSIEAAQLDTGADLLEHAQAVLKVEEPGRSLSDRELRWIVDRLCQALADALQVAECRGGRLSGEGNSSDS